MLDLIGGRDIEAAALRILGPGGTFVTVVGPERFIGDRALRLSAVLAVLARVGLRIIGSRIRGPRYVLTGPSPSSGREMAEVARAAAS